MSKEEAIYIETRFVVHGSKTQRKMANFGEVRVVEKCRAIRNLQPQIPTQISTHPMLQPLLTTCQYLYSFIYIFIQSPKEYLWNAHLI